MWYYDPEEMGRPQSPSLPPFTDEEEGTKDKDAKKASADGKETPKKSTVDDSTFSLFLEVCSSFHKKK